jgi:hypothetical protein
MRTWGLRLTLCCGSLFLGANVLRILYSIRVPCSCFGEIYKAGPLQMAGLDLAMIVLGALALVYETKEVRT